MMRVTRVVADATSVLSKENQDIENDLAALSKEELIAIIHVKDKSMRNLQQAVNACHEPAAAQKTIKSEYRPFNILSDECIMSTALHLKPKFFFNLMCTSKRMKEIIDCDAYWERVVVHALYFDTGLHHDLEFLGMGVLFPQHRRDVRYEKMYMLFEGYKSAIDLIVSTVLRKYECLLNDVMDNTRRTAQGACLKDIISFLMALHQAQAQFYDLVDADDVEQDVTPLAILIVETSRAIAKTSASEIFHNMVRQGTISPVNAFHRKLEEYPISVKAKMDMLTLFRTFLFNSSIAMLESDCEYNRRASSLVRGLSQSSALRLIQDDLNVVRRPSYRGYDPLCLYPGTLSKVSYDIIDQLTPPDPPCLHLRPPESLQSDL